MTVSKDFFQIYTGLQHDIVRDNQANGLPLELPTIADKLKEVGYSTHAVEKWHIGFYKKEYTPIYRGFDSYYGTVQLASLKEFSILNKLQIR